MIGVVDYGVGNVRSVVNALTAVGASVQRCATPEALASADKLVLPGVGAFGDAMARLQPLRAALQTLVVEQQRPVLGLCVGMQMLATRGFEHGEHAGLDWIAGEVHPMPAQLVGWNTLNRTANPSRLNPEGTFYFVHGYHFVPRDAGVITAQADDVVAAIEHGHIMGTQFHPEKSQKDGLRLLERFVAC